MVVISVAQLGGVVFVGRPAFPGRALAATFCTPPASMRTKFLARHLTSTPSAVKSPDCNGPDLTAQRVRPLPYKLPFDPT
jgi:hypothetical protein